MPSRHSILHESRVNFWKETLLRNYVISSNGFLPRDLPLAHLPGVYYKPWEDILDRLSSLVKDWTYRDTVDRLEVLSTEKLRSEEEWRRAYVILTFIAHGYIWGGPSPAEILPPSISVPLLEVCDRLDLPPAATYAALNLWNFTSLTNDFTDLDSLRSLHTFTGTEDESWFYCVSVAMEARGGEALPVMLHAIEVIRSQEHTIITHCLEKLTKIIEDLGQLLERMYERCDPTVFYHRIRPFLAGSKNMAAAGLSRGVFFDEGEGHGTWTQLRGGSNGQSSLIQFFDVILGVEHDSGSKGDSKGLKQSVNGNGGTGQTPGFHQEVRNYMPAPHRWFLEYVARKGNLREFVLRSGHSDDEVAMRMAYQAAVNALGDLRTRHIGIVTRYIVIPSRKSFETSTINLSSASSRSSLKEEDRLTGTGGTALIPFLSKSRDETYSAAKRDVAHM